ncbi:hypothetical protein [Thioalkalivibrio sp. HK1]|uniref:hypothetical protein n=1 Tax=Thioalkalivibrio sp. HK1 TaxID=1469245 RepID=UPI0012DD4D81|nr:hypothetical protein [Thioalkalivibrio sp. HK1]
MRELTMMIAFMLAGFVGSAHADASCDAQGGPPSDSASLDSTGWIEYQPASSEPIQTASTGNGGLFDDADLFIAPESTQICDTNVFACFHLPNEDPLLDTAEQQQAILVILFVYGAVCAITNGGPGCG